MQFQSEAKRSLRHALGTPEAPSKESRIWESSLSVDTVGFDHLLKTRSTAESTPDDPPRKQTKAQSGPSSRTVHSDCSAARQLIARHGLSAVLFERRTEAGSPLTDPPPPPPELRTPPAILQSSTSSLPPLISVSATLLDSPLFSPFSITSRSPPPPPPLSIRRRLFESRTSAPLSFSPLPHLCSALHDRPHCDRATGAKGEIGAEKRSEGRDCEGMDEKELRNERKSGWQHGRTDKIDGARDDEWDVCARRRVRVRSKDKDGEEKREEHEQEGLGGKKALVQTPPPPLFVFLASYPVTWATGSPAGPSHITSHHITALVTGGGSLPGAHLVSAVLSPQLPLLHPPAFLYIPPSPPPFFLFEPLFLSCQVTTVCSVQCHHTHSPSA